MQTFTLEEGTTVFHGTSQTGFEELSDPSWVSTSVEVAHVFKRRHRGPRERVLVFQTVRPLKLLMIEDEEDYVEAILESGADPVNDEMSEIAEAFAWHYRGKYDGWIIPHNYPEGDDILLSDPAGDLEYVGELQRK